jgi:hypothetical protein
MSMPKESFNDDHLIRYLLGCLPEDEAERLDEQSLIEDELAERLRLAEDDLVDAYASGTLTGERRARFESYYLVSRRRRKKAAFAKSFLSAIDRSEQRRPAVPRPTRENLPTRARVWLWTPAAAAVLILGVSVLLVQERNLRRDLNDARRQTADATVRTSTVSKELEEQRREAAATAQALADARAAARPLATIALVLRPQTRGVGPTPLISVAPGSRTVPLDLECETTDPASYEVALKDPATNRVIWRSAPVMPRRDRRTTVVSVGVPAGQLKAQHYSVDLFELRPGATPEFVASYAFEVARQ